MDKWKYPGDVETYVCDSLQSDIFRNTCVRHCGSHLGRKGQGSQRDQGTQLINEVHVSDASQPPLTAAAGCGFTV